MTIPPPPQTSDPVGDECRRVLYANWRQGTRVDDGVEFGYTSPNLGHYPWQWYWDSCFTAVSWRRFDPARSELELRSLLSAARPDGFIGHTIFWNTPLTGPRRLTYNVVGPSPRMTSSIQPPLLAWAWRIAVGDPALEPGIVRHHQWLERNRDLEGDGLLWIVQPDESGLDASCQFDPVWRWRAHSQPGFLGLVWRNRRDRYDARQIARRGGPVVCEVMTNVLYSLSRSALGKPSLTEALIDRCYDAETGLFQSDVRPPLGGGDPHPEAAPGVGGARPGRPSGIGTVRGLPVACASLAPLALPDLPEEIGHRLIRQYVLNREEFWLPAGIPSVARSAPGFQRRDDGLFGIHRYWRGPVWVNAAWLVWLGLTRLGYVDAARTLAERMRANVVRQGLREYYDPFDGSGMGQRDFAWSTLILELTDPDPRAGISYL